MPDAPFDWEEDEARRQRESWEHWYRQADNTALLAGQFWALWDRHMRDYEELREKINDIEERLVEVRAKHFAADLVGTLWGRLVIVALAILTAAVLTNTPASSWWPFG